MCDLTIWIGLQFVNKNSALRVKNIGTASGTTFNDNFAFEVLSKFPVGVAPDVCLCVVEFRFPCPLA